MTWRARTIAGAMMAVMSGCGGAAGGPAGGGAGTTPRAAATTDVVGLTTRDDIEHAVPGWRDAIAAADPADDVARSLASVPPGAEVDVFLGTWCGDSRREISRLFVALAMAEAAGPLPFTIRFIGVDRAKVAPGLTDGVDLRYVPTILVRRDGQEVGRIVETATRGIEQDLHDLLTGERSGWISLTRTE